MKSKHDLTPGGVEAYILNCPKEVQKNLQITRSAVQNVAPDSIETVSYFEMPGYFYENYDYNEMFVWFSYKDPYVRLHVRPPVIENYLKELVGYVTTKSIVSFPKDKEVPVSLVKDLVRDSLEVMLKNTK